MSYLSFLGLHCYIQTYKGIAYAPNKNQQPTILSFPEFQLTGFLGLGLLGRNWAVTVILNICMGFHISNFNGIMQYSMMNKT